MDKITLPIRKLHEDATVPAYAHETDAGFDLHALEDVIVEPGETALVKTGIAADIPPGYELQIRPRSGITRKTKLRVQLGTIDSGYRADIGIIVDNISTSNPVGSTPRLRTIDNKSEYHDGTFYLKNTYLLRKGDRIAQAVLAPIAHASFIEVDEFDGETARGANGFGSSGVK